MENNWKNSKLGDLVEILSSRRVFYSDYVENGIPFYRSKEVIDFAQGNFYQPELFISKDKFEELIAKNGYPLDGDILISAVGERAGIPYVVKNLGEFYFKDGNVIWIKSSDNLSNEFLSYWLKSFVGIETLNSLFIGSAQKALTIVGLKNIEIQLPPLPEQKAIASVLSSLDDKIDLLHQQNQTLEALAETLFRQWFIEEAKEDWEEIKFGDVVTVKRGGSPRPIQDYLSDSGYRWLKISDATKENSPFIFDIKEHIKVEGLNKTTYLEAGKLVLSNSATPGLPKILQVDTCIHDGWLHFPKSKFSNEFLYLFFKKIRPELENMGNGSIFTNLKTDILKEFELRLPDDITLQKFDVIIKDYFNKILINQQQIQTLTQLRDTLLPKLMSGEVRVKM